MPKSMLRRFVVYGELVFLLGLGVFYGYRLWLCGPGMLINPFPVRTADYDLASGQHQPVQVADLLTSTPLDFPEFLGPGRKLFVDNVQLNPDWKNHPPQEVWRQPIGAGWSAFSVVNGYAVTMEQRGNAEQVTCCDVLTGSPCWVVSWDARFLTAGVGPRSTPTIEIDNHAYGLSEGVLECVNLDAGSSCWKEGRYGHGQILRVGNLLLVISDKGALSLVAPDPESPNNVLGSLQALNARTWNNLALYGRYLLVRNAEEAVCYQLEILKEADDECVER